MSLHGERWLIGGILGSLGMQGRYLVHRECRGDTDWTYRKIHLRFSASRESDYTGKRITFILIRTLTSWPYFGVKLRKKLPIVSLR